MEGREADFAIMWELVYRTPPILARSCRERVGAVGSSAQKKELVYKTKRILALHKTTNGTLNELGNKFKFEQLYWFLSTKDVGLLSKHFISFTRTQTRHWP